MTLSPDSRPPMTAAPPAAHGQDTLALAERALGERNTAAAKTMLDRALLDDPGNARAKLLLAEVLLADGALAAAEEAFAGLFRVPEVAASAQQGHGLALLLAGHRARAADGLRRAVSADPALWRAWNALGYIYDLDGAWARAERSYTLALAAHPGSAEVYNNRGFSRLMQRRLTEAADDLNRALEIDPRFDLARDNLRLVLAWQGKYRHALTGLRTTDEARVLNNVGYIALMRGDYVNAEAYLLRAMEIDPRYNETASRNLTYLHHVRALAGGGALTPE